MEKFIRTDLTGEFGESVIIIENNYNYEGEYVNGDFHRYLKNMEIKPYSILHLRGIEFKIVENVNLTRNKDEMRNVRKLILESCIFDDFVFCGSYFPSLEEFELDTRGWMKSNWPSVLKYEVEKMCAKSSLSLFSKSVRKVVMHFGHLLSPMSVQFSNLDNIEELKIVGAKTIAKAKNEKKKLDKLRKLHLSNCVDVDAIRQFLPEHKLDSIYLEMCGFKHEYVEETFGGAVLNHALVYTFDPMLIFNAKCVSITYSPLSPNHIHEELNGVKKLFLRGNKMNKLSFQAPDLEILEVYEEPLDNLLCINKNNFPKLKLLRIQHCNEGRNHYITLVGFEDGECVLDFTENITIVK
jgi:hypothetical protein